MKQKFITCLYIALIVIVIIASMLILRHTVKPAITVEQSPLDSYIVGATLIEYNEQGQLKSSTLAEKVDHFESRTYNTTLFIKPYMISYGADRTEWHIHANRATTAKTGDTILLEGNVIFHELPNEKHPETTIKTSRLTLFPKKSLGITKENVTLIRPGTVVHGKGLIANFKTDQYQLDSESQAIYLPQPKVKKVKKNPPRRNAT